MLDKVSRKRPQLLREIAPIGVTPSITSPETLAVDEMPGKTERIVVSAPKFRTATINIIGTTPYVGNKMGARALAKMRASQEQGQQARSKKVREPRKFKDEHKEKVHLSKDGWAGIPCAAFRWALIDCCRLVGYHMTMAKMSLFVLPDGLDVDDGQPLVRIHSPAEPRALEMTVRLANKSTDIMIRPQWLKWSCKLQLRWDEDQFSAQDVMNLLIRAGEQCGVGAGRNFSKQSPGLGWGCFQVADQDQTTGKEEHKRKAKQA